MTLNKELSSLAAEVVARKKNDSGEAKLDTSKYVGALYNFNETIRLATTKEVNEFNKEFGGSLTKFVAAAKNQGWSSLGSWYWTLAGYNQEINEIIGDLPSYSAPDYTVVLDVDPDIKTYLGRLGDFNKRVSEENEREIASRSAARATDGGAMNEIIRWVSVPGTALVESSVEIMTGEGDPIGSMQLIGHGIIDAVWTTVGIGILAKASVGGVDAAANESGAGFLAGLVSFGGTNAAARFTDSVAGSLVFVIGILALPVFLAGITFAYYLPAIPFILWTMAMIGWVMLVIESIIAAPLWAAAHAIPEGEGMAGQQAKQGYMLFLNVMMRPPLMVFGFFFAQVVMMAVGGFIAGSFLKFMYGTQFGGEGSYAMGPVSAIMWIIIFGGIITVTAKKVFGLITWLPDNVMRWVGQQVQNLGEGQDEERTRTIFAAALQNMPRSASGKGESPNTDPGPRNPVNPGASDLDAGEAPPKEPPKASNNNKDAI